MELYPSQKTPETTCHHLINLRGMHQPHKSNWKTSLAPTTSSVRSSQLVHNPPSNSFHQQLDSFHHISSTGQHDIIVGGDWKDYLNAPNSLLVRLCTTLQLVDPWLHHFPEKPAFATHERGTQRIESVLISHSVDD